MVTDQINIALSHLVYSDMVDFLDSVVNSEEYGWDYLKGARLEAFNDKVDD